MTSILMRLASPSRPVGAPLRSVIHFPADPPRTQGFGNVGSWAARILHEQRGRVVAVADAFGAVTAEAGLDIPALVLHMAAGGRCARALAEQLTFGEALMGVTSPLTRPSLGPAEQAPSATLRSAPKVAPLALPCAVWRPSPAVQSCTRIAS